ncbi:hypothetical protein LSCM4_05351 [Leishmania orientalis]|uniref:Uncharacterized protein n=1 Tax=Leishmania orientalis TaxID=2249476 RepID=A0A836HHH0_9TRYP|nr:hypothetical protein LSCM4_05351 [Leishmania orientalis]
MWKRTLIEIGDRAGKKAVLPALNTLPKTVAAGLSISSARSGNSLDPLFSSEADKLCNSRNDYLTQLQSSTLYSSLSTSTPAVRTNDEIDTLLRSAQALPFLFAQEAFCALIKAGEVHSALQLTASWEYQRPKRLRLIRKKARRELLSTIRALEEVKDASTLKALIDLLSAALKEQQLAHRSTLQAVSLTHSDACPSVIQYKLFAPLGLTATAYILVCTAEAACRLSDRDGMSVFEKLMILDKCADASITTAGTARLPYRLYRLLEVWTAERVLDAKFAEKLCPDLPLKLVHPSHYTALDILSLNAKEARYIQKNWVSRSLFQHSSGNKGEVSKWSCVMGRVLASSTTLQAVEANCLLVSLMCSHGKPDTACNGHSLNTARKHILRLLHHSQPSVRRETALSLMKKRSLFAALKISPCATACVYLQSFYSKNVVDPALCKLCTALLFRLCRAGQHIDAAQMIWNHLSVECPATAALFKKNAIAVNFAVVAVSRAMRVACANKYAKRWMGYRSLALLRTAASASHSVTVMHCAPVCARALECGVPFAAVNEALSYVFRGDAGQKAWAVDLVRLCSDAELIPTKVKVNRCGLSTDTASHLAQMCRVQGNQDGNVVLQTPSRSRQLALWTTVTEPHSNPCLNALMAAVFLSRTARDSILECTWCRHHSQSSQAVSQKEHEKQMSLSDMWNWEVAAGIASNCCNDENFMSFVECLKRRKPLEVSRTGNIVDNLAALLCSEQDAYHPPFVVSQGQY